MFKLLRISLERRGVSCPARLLEKDAPRTCAAVWEALADGPLAGPAQHTEYARDEVYTMVSRFGSIGRANTTVTPIPGDVCLFDFAGGVLDTAFEADLAIFHGRSLLINGDVGWVPGNVFGAIRDGLDGMAEACHDVWRSGSVGERSVYSRVDA